MLKKTISSMFVGLLVAATSASAAINVVYSGIDGFLRSDDATGLTEPANGSQTALAQLIFTTVNGYGDAGVGATVGAGESMLLETVITDSFGTDIYGVLPATSYNGTYSPGYLYVRIFDQGTGLGGSGVGIGTWYYNSPLVATINNNTPETPDVFTVNGGNVSPSFGVGDVLNLQVVPEPATFALLGLGGLVLAVRRRFSV